MRLIRDGLNLLPLLLLMLLLLREISPSIGGTNIFILQVDLGLTVLQNTLQRSRADYVRHVIQDQMEISAFLAAVRSDDELQHQLRGVTTAAGLAEVANRAGFAIEAAALVKGFAQLLLEGDDPLCVRNFDNLGWDMGELLWAIKTWEYPKES